MKTENEYKISTIGKIALVSFCINSIILGCFLWIGHYYLHLGYDWIHHPVMAGIIIHSIIKVALSIFIVYGVVVGPNPVLSENPFWTKK